MQHRHLNHPSCPSRDGRHPLSLESREAEGAMDASPTKRWVTMLILLGISLILMFISPNFHNILISSNNYYDSQDKSHHEYSSEQWLLRNQQKILNYRNGTALIINLHVTHHGGTTTSAALGRAPNTSGCPNFNCNDGKNDPAHINETDYPYYRPWKYNSTAKNIAMVRRYFHFIGWEWGDAGVPKAGSQLWETNWEDPNLVSIYVTRDPISRMLARNGYVDRIYPFVQNKFIQASKEDWMAFADDDKCGDNYALRLLAGGGCCNGTLTDQQHLEHAKTLLSRFTFILDIACLVDGLQEVASYLAITELNKQNPKGPRPNFSISVPYPDVYQHMLDRNRRSIDLHQWAKERALVRCSDGQRQYPNLLS